MSPVVVTAALDEAGIQSRHASRGPRGKLQDGGFIRDGYRYCPVADLPDTHPMKAELLASGRRYYPEHRLVMSAHLGRPLRLDESVHHKDTRNRADNRIEKLQLRNGQHGKGAHMVCGDCGSQNVVPAAL